MPPSEPPPNHRRGLFPLLNRAEREIVTKWLLRLGPYVAFLGLVAGFVASIPPPLPSTQIPTIPCALSVPTSANVTAPKMTNSLPTSSSIGTLPPVPSETSQPSTTTSITTTPPIPSTTVPTITTTLPLTDTKVPPSSPQSIPKLDSALLTPSTIASLDLPVKPENFPTSGRRSSETITVSSLPNDERHC